MSIFEVIMLICFGVAWPFSIYKSYKTKQIEGKSVTFLFIVFIGYISGILHKLIYKPDRVVFLYILNSIMVATDIILFLINKRALSKKNT